MTLKKRLRNAKRHFACIGRPRRNQQEVGQSCRGSINLQDARIHADKATHSIIIAGTSQTFHLKAQNEVDQRQWLTALECARHRANRAADSDEDEDFKLDGLSNGRVAAFEAMVKNFTVKMDELRTCSSFIDKHGNELLRTLNETEPNDKSRVLADRISIFKITVSAMMKSCDEFLTVVTKETRKMERVTANEHKQRILLQDQLEELAQQHSNLERAAYRTARESDLNSDPPFLDTEEEFHDASDKMTDLRNDDRKSSSSHTDSICEETDREMFDAEIVTPNATTEQYSMEPRMSLVPIDKSVARNRRARILERPQVGLNLWSIMRNCIGKELSKIPMPVNFNEPLSVLQRISEDLEYAHLLDTAAECEDPLEQLCYIAAYAVSSYSTTGNRTTKPFNPLLGETFECDRTNDLGWKSLAEQVSHHPPITAHHADGRQWSVHQDFTMTSRFRGKYLSVIPIGYSHVQFRNQKNVYSFKKVTTTVHNIIVGKLWIDNHGEMVIDNHATGDKCHLKFHPYSYFSRDIPRKVTGLVKDSTGKVQWIIQGTWDRSLDLLKVLKNQDNKGEKSVFETAPPRRMWTVNPPYPDNEKMYFFTRLAIELNEPESGVAPTDSRLRPDQRLMEDGQWEDANRVKVEIEEKQRAVRRRTEALAEKALQAGDELEEYRPLWFRKAQHEPTGTVIHMFTGEYWNKKKHGDWSMCPNIF